MATFTIAPTAITANVQKNSASQTVPTASKSVFIQLTDTGMWATTIGHITQWGVQYSKDGGATWNWGPVWQNNVPFGAVGKDGKLPQLEIANDLNVGLNAGDLVRLAILVDTNITLGATITVS